MACIGHGSTIMRVEKVCTNATSKIQWSFLRLLPRNIYWFSIHYLECLALIMIWLCCQDRHCFEAFCQRGFTLQLWSQWNHYMMGYYVGDGIYPPWDTLVNKIPRPETQKASRFAMMKSRQANTWRDLSVCFRSDFPLFVACWVLQTDSSKFWSILLWIVYTLQTYL
jgi:hypothetical protein